MRMKRRQQMKMGFTLIELMVVIGIFAVMSAILIPQFVRWKDSNDAAQATQELMSALSRLSANARAAENPSAIQFLDSQNFVEYFADPNVTLTYDNAGNVLTQSATATAGGFKVVQWGPGAITTQSPGFQPGTFPSAMLVQGHNTILFGASPANHSGWVDPVAKVNFGEVGPLGVGGVGLTGKTISLSTTIALSGGSTNPFIALNVSANGIVTYDITLMQSGGVSQVTDASVINASP